MKLSENLTIPASAADAAAMYADESYAEVRRATLRASSASSRVEGDPAGAFTVRTEIAMTTEKVPDVARRFVGATVTIREEQVWSAPGADGARTGTMSIDVAGTPATFTAALALTPQGEATSQVVIDGDLTVKVPLLGGKLEKTAVPYVSKVLRAEERAARTYQDSRSR
ncbi:DUF2505 domain-containing protein [Brachybacterium sp. NBEC-018]|uniref:DUF2505 domain-containing protein n=1 Tax=Brachybacterium sp. NBEC-018 TaxID=2996004 RepID=UPI0021756578|nr:DUF2505 domain-containing protein [Brachybacterium sp. NBEC-018]UVY82461.1 DUF2505 domain-containing protein [Brachybacterium sp. NBEC-018]